METLFDQIERTDEGPASYGEPIFEYLNTSSRVEADMARDKLDQIYIEFQANHPAEANDLKQRFRSSDDEHHLGALTELYIYHMLKQNGFTVIPHPEIEGTTSRPDFLASKNGEDAFLIEAKVVFGSNDEIRTRKFVHQISNAIDEINSPEFLISMIIESEDRNNPPKVGEIKKGLQTLVDSLDYDEVCRKYEETEELPKWSYTQHGWKLNFEVTAVTEEGKKSRNSESRNLGATVHPVREVLLYENLKMKAAKKIKKYGDRPLPLVIATNVISGSTFCDVNEIMATLFGREKVTITNYSDGSQETKTRRTLDGLLVHPKHGYKNTRMSALMVIPGLNGFTFEKIEPTLWHHPQPKNALSKEYFDVKQRIHNPTTDRMEEI